MAKLYVMPWTPNPTQNLATPQSKIPHLDGCYRLALEGRVGLVSKTGNRNRPNRNCQNRWNRQQPVGHTHIVQQTPKLPNSKTGIRPRKGSRELQQRSRPRRSEANHATYLLARCAKQKQCVFCFTALQPQAGHQEHLHQQAQASHDSLHSKAQP